MADGSSLIPRNARLRHEFGEDHTSLALDTFYFALLRGVPGVNGVEPDNTGDYGRVALDNDELLWGTIGGSAVSVSNIVPITWPTATALWSVTDALDHWAIYDSASGGDLWYWGLLTTTITVTGVGDTPRIPNGALTIFAPE